MGRRRKGEFARVKGSSTEHATVVRNDGVSKQPFEFSAVFGGCRKLKSLLIVDE